jgi:hypothetical protein
VATSVMMWTQISRKSLLEQGHTDTQHRDLINRFLLSSRKEKKKIILSKDEKSEKYNGYNTISFQFHHRSSLMCLVSIFFHLMLKLFVLFLGRWYK